VAHELNDQAWVLLVDDDRSLAPTLEAFLGRYGVELVSALGPEEAAVILRSRQPTLCLVDLNLFSTIDGFIVLRGLRHKFGKSLPLLAVSGSKGIQAVRRALESGADDFLGKPLDLAELKSKLGRYLQLDRENLPPSPFRATPSGGIRSELEINARVEKANELGLRVSSPHFVDVGTPLLVSCPLLEEAFGQMEAMGTVSDCALAEDGSYWLSLSFEELTAEQRAAWRHCLHQRSHRKRS